MIKKYFWILMLLICVNSAYAVMPPPDPDNERHITLNLWTNDFPMLYEFMPIGFAGMPEYSYYIPPGDNNITLPIPGQQPITIPLAQYVESAIQEWQRVAREANSGVNVFTIRRETNPNNAFMRVVISNSSDNNDNEEAVTELGTWDENSPPILRPTMTLYRASLGEHVDNLFRNNSDLFSPGKNRERIANIDMYATILHEVGHTLLMDHPDDEIFSSPILSGLDAFVTEDDVNIMVSNSEDYFTQLLIARDNPISNLDDIYLLPVDGRALRSLFYTPPSTPDPNDNWLPYIDFGDGNHPFNMGISQGSFSPW